MSIFHNWMVHCTYHFHLNRSFVYVKCRRMEVLHRSVSLSVIPFQCDCNHSERQVIFIQLCMLVLNLHSAPLDNTALFVEQLYWSALLIKKGFASKLFLIKYGRSASLTCFTSCCDAKQWYGVKKLVEWVSQQKVQPFSTWHSAHLSSSPVFWNLGTDTDKMMWWFCLYFNGMSCCDPRNFPLKEYFNLCRWAHQSCLLRRDI